MIDESLEYFYYLSSDTFQREILYLCYSYQRIGFSTCSYHIIALIFPAVIHLFIVFLFLHFFFISIVHFGLILLLSFLPDLTA